MTPAEIKKLPRGQALRLNDGVIVVLGKVSGTGHPIVGWPSMGGTCPVEPYEVVEALNPTTLVGEEKRDYETALMSIERYL